MYDALILAGGAARRLGGVDKPALEIGGATLLDRVLGAVGDASRVVVVGPPRPVAGVGVVWCVEDPPGGGPVAAIAAGLTRTAAEVVLVLAADLPWVAPAVPMLRTALADDPEAGVALLVDPTGRANHLAAAWRRAPLMDALAALGEPSGAPVRALTSAVAVTRVSDPHGWGRDCDVWPDVEAARAELS